MGEFQMGDRVKAKACSHPCDFVIRETCPRAQGKELCEIIELSPSHDKFYRIKSLEVDNSRSGYYLKNNCGFLEEDLQKYNNIRYIFEEILNGH